MTSREIPEMQASDAKADKALHFVANFVKHSPNLAIDSLAKDDAQPGRFNGVHGIDPRPLSVEHDALV